jgi:hypothetical protein
MTTGQSLDLFMNEDLKFSVSDNTRNARGELVGGMTTGQPLGLKLATVTGLGRSLDHQSIASA